MYWFNKNCAHKKICLGKLGICKKRANRNTRVGDTQLLLACYFLVIIIVVALICLLIYVSFVSVFLCVFILIIDENYDAFFKLCVASIKLFAFHYQCIKWIERFLSRRFQRFFKLQIYERDLERCMMFAVIRNVDIFDVRVSILINFYFGRF